ncbi:hypothetical protein [Rhodococcus sp. (in: high G+C Gram-positive bacteria)]|uniref:hypothetical protein n=1 Tax=Rhodococcus sp. TaxID=1831 RepID=UPI00257CA5D6|nr:hypothetical protein [Rhodococcus sp. (in: high G+C Gram-positive bacteria)]MBQ7803043.1 hypothetical protein [Rhodococcus sp. (in: high G+C Gram-positive bacteria)]
MFLQWCGDRSFGRRVVNDASYRTELTVEELANDGTFTAVLRIPDAAGQLTIIADMRTNKITCSTQVAAPDEGTAGKRVTWMLRQLKNAPADLLIEATFTGPGSSTCEPHTAVRVTPRILTDNQSGQLHSFTLMRTFTSAPNEPAPPPVSSAASPTPRKPSTPT